MADVAAAVYLGGMVEGHDLQAWDRSDQRKWAPEAGSVLSEGDEDCEAVSVSDDCGRAELFEADWVRQNVSVFAALRKGWQRQRQIQRFFASLRMTAFNI